MVQKSKTGLNLFEDLEFRGSKKWRKEPPEPCPYCLKEGAVTGIEILGAYDGTLFWECKKCGERMLRFTKRTTIKHLSKSANLFIDLEGLENIWEQLPN